jgi:hypothetical protein
MSGTQRGNELERRAKEWLEAQGYKVHRTYRSFYRDPVTGQPRSKTNDLYKCFDLLAVHRERSPRMVQVSTDDNDRQKRRKIEQEFGIDPAGLMCEVWSWHRGKNFFRIYRLIMAIDGELSWVTVGDFRKGDDL